MRIIKLLGLILIAAILASFSACGKGAMIAEDLRQNILTAGEDITSFRFEGTMSMTCEEQEELNMTMNMDGAGDIENMNIYMHMSTDTSEGTMDMEMYMITDDPEQTTPSITAYMIMEMGGESTGWMSMEVPYSELEEQNQLSQQLEAFTFDEVRHAGEETIDGTECYVFEITLDMDEMMEFVMQQAGMEDSLEGITLSEFQDMLGDASIKYWVDKDSDLPTKQQMQFSMTIEGITVDYDLTMSLYDYNEPLEITLPDGIEAQPMVA